MIVRANTYAAVRDSVCAQLGIDERSAKGKRAGVITGHVLDWWFGHRANDFRKWEALGGDWSNEKAAKSYVRQEVGFFWSILFPFLINAVVQMLIEWLMSDDSAAFREAVQS